MRLSQLVVSGSGGDFEGDIYHDLLNSSVFLSGTRDILKDNLLINTTNSNMSFEVETTSYTFTAGQILESGNLADPLQVSGDLDQCLVSVDYTDSGVPTIEVSADNVNWETVNNNQIHHFTNTGTQLRIRFTGGGSGSIYSWCVLYNKDSTVYTLDGRSVAISEANSIALLAYSYATLPEPPNDELINPTGLGGPPGSTGVLTFRACYINETTGVVSIAEGPDLMLNSTNDTTPDQQLIAYKIWNAVWNDIADFQTLAEDEELVYGKCYYDTKLGARLCNESCQKSVIGIASDTFGHGLGSKSGENSVPIAVAGWVLAHVNEVEGYEYKSGDILTNDDNASLVYMNRDLAKEFPERIVATYKKKEEAEYFGTDKTKIEVNGRHWVKVKS